MNIFAILKDAFLFPSKNTGRFAIYLLLSVLIAGFIFGGVLTYEFGLFDSQNYLVGGMYLIIALLLIFIVSGYHISVIKSGIELDDKIPVFKLYENFMTGFDNMVVSIVYFSIPALIVLVVGYDTNLFSNAMAIVSEFFMQIFNVFIMGDSINIATNALSNTVSNFVGSLAITFTVATFVFLIFLVIQSMAEARLANTGSLKEALNIFEAIKDIFRIGLGRVILLFILLVVIIIGIEIILTIVLSSFMFLLFVLYIIITPYLALVTQRSLGLMYSDIT